MSNPLNITTAAFGGLREVTTAPLWQYDYGQILKITGLDLPQAFEVHFSNSRKSGETITQIGTDSQVVIPDMYLTSGADIYAFVFLHDGTDDGETEYVIKIPVRERPEPSDIEPTPEQQDAITEAIAALNTAVTQTGQDVISADASATAAAQSEANAAESERQAGLSAQSAAQSKTAAEIAQGKTEDAQRAAELAQGKAEDAKQDSETAKREAEQAANRAEQAAASIVPVDPTLTIAGRAADAKATGDRLDSLTETVGGKQDTLTFDDAPTSGSANPVKSGGVFNAVDTKISKPLTNPMGTNGQLLRTLGNGQTEWTDQGLPTDEQTAQAVSDWLDDHPEATTTVEDGAITIPKFSQSTKDLIVVQTEDDKNYEHDVTATKLTFYPDERISNEPCRYIAAKNLLEGYLGKGTTANISRVLNGRFIDVQGTGSGQGLTIFSSSNAAFLNSLKGKTVNIYFYLKKSTPWEKGSYLGLWDGASYKIKATFTKDSTTLFGWSAFENIQINPNATILLAKFDSSADLVFAEGDFWWMGIYESPAVAVNTEHVITGDTPYIYDVAGIDYADTMLHKSVATYAVSTKEYVDEHTPDIIGYWNERVYVLPEHFGALGDGVTDDSQAIADCLAYASTYNKAVRGYGRYKTTQPIILDARYMDVYLREIIYSGDDCAVDLQNSYITFGFHRIQSTNIGIRFSRTTSGTVRNSQRCKVVGNEIASQYDCVVCGGGTYYHTVEIRVLSSDNGNCISHVDGENLGAGEYVFRDSTCRCPNGYVTYNIGASKFYNFTIEGNCRYGMLNPRGCLCVGFRHREQCDGMAYRVIDGNTSYNNGPLIIFTKQPNPDGRYGFKYISQDPLPWYSVDASAIQSYANIPAGSDGYDEWLTCSFNSVNLGTPVRGIYSTGRLVFGENAYFISGYLVLENKNRTVSSITEDVDFRSLDGRTDEDIVAGVGVAKCLCTDFVVNVSHADIHFNSYFGAVGYNDLTVTQDNGNTCTIYDKLGNVLFDGTNEGNGKWNLRCIIDRSSNGRYQGAITYWGYDGTNEIWEVEKIG